MAKIPHRFNLTEEQMPTQWYNLRADMKEQPDPMLNPATLEPVKTPELYPIFCEELAAQEMDSTTRYIDIPEPVLNIYKAYRPSPLNRAYDLEKYLDTPAKIYFKFEGNNTSGSHKLNSAVAQAYYAKMQGITSLTTETGAGHRPCGGLRLFRHPADRVHGKGFLQPKTLPQSHHADLWRECHPKPERYHEGGPRHPGK